MKKPDVKREEVTLSFNLADVQAALAEKRIETKKPQLVH